MSGSTNSGSSKLWGGRFSGSLDPLFERFNASIGFDRRLCFADVDCSVAYAKALGRSHVLHDDEVKQLVDGLACVRSEWEKKEFEIREGDEDIHTANERRLTELLGDVAGKLHTGRSRNDQVATDMRFWMMQQIDHLQHLVVVLIGSAVECASEHIDVLMPGYTHLQPAQPIRFSHLVLSYAWAWRRDAARLADLRKRVSVLPLGSGALAGNPFNIDRDFLARELGFDRISANSLDAVSNRDFIAEFLFWASMTMVHISQFAEDFIIMASKKLVIIADAYSTGSSLMPQKKNPDALELLRGKTGRVTGSLVGILTTLKGLPRAYNKDLQEDKEGLFDALDTAMFSLQISAGVLATLVPDARRLRAELVPEMLATDLAEYLVRKGVPFRDTHHIAGAAVKIAEEQSKPLSSVTVEELQKLHSAFDEDVSKVWDYATSVETRNAAGGTSKSAVEQQLVAMQVWLDGNKQ